MSLTNKILDRFRFFDDVATFLLYRVRRRRILDYMATRPIHPTVRLGDVYLDKNVAIEEGTYINSGQLFAGQNSWIRIGRFCAIGYNVRIKARSHDPVQPTRRGWEDIHQKVEADIVIGDHVWLGDNVFVKHGVKIGDHAIVGANSVVTHHVPACAVVGGIPARLIRMRNKETVAQ